MMGFTVGAGTVIFVLALNGFTWNVGVLCDAFSTAGLLMILVSGLLFVRGEGVFLGVGYALKNVLRVFLPRIGEKVETYGQYRERKTGNAKPQEAGVFFFTGVLFLTIGVLFLILWIKK